MAQKLYNLIDTLKPYPPWLDDFLRGNSDWYEYVRFDWDEFDSNRTKLRLLQRICSCLGMFFLDENLESFLNGLAISINKVAKKIYFLQKTRASSFLEARQKNAANWLLSFRRVMKILDSLFEKAFEMYMHSQFKDCSMEELVDFIQLVSEDGKEIHSGISLKSLQLHKLGFLKDFISFASSRGAGEDVLQDLLAHTKSMVTVAAYCSYMNLYNDAADEATVSMIRSQYNEMLKVQPQVREIYIRVLKASRSSCSSHYTRMDDDKVGAFINSLVENHCELLASDCSFTVSAMKIIREELRFMRNFLVHQRQKAGDLDKKMIDLVVQAAIEAGILTHSHYWDDLKEDLIKDAELGLSNWIEKVELLKREIAKKHPETSIYKFPRTSELGFMDVLLKDLREFVGNTTSSTSFAQGEMDAVLEDLVFLRDFLRSTAKQHNDHEELKALWILVVDIAYKTDFIIHSLVIGDPSPDCSPASFIAIKQEIKRIRSEVKETYMEKRFLIEAANTRKISNHLPSRSSNPTMDEVIVGFEDEAEKIIDLLKANSAPLDIVSIVGMPGQGKTTLAKKVYNDIRAHFHVCAWCCISQGYEKRKLLLDILNDTLNELPSGFNKMKDEDLEELLYKSLKGKRYLIVLDDIWDIEAWHGLKLSLPNDHNQSRILLTSRIQDVALLAKPGSKHHSLRLLKDAEIKELLQKKLHHQEVSPSELQNLGVQIAEICKGLPLAVLTVAGILATLEKDSWDDFVERLTTSSINGTEECTGLLELSYGHLPDYLKPCLLYFGSFLQDEEIPVSRLMWLWMAEGFVHRPIKEERLENVAMDCLKNLVNRSLVQVVKQRSRGGIKTCSVHDLVHQFCVTKAKEENFLQILNLGQKPLPLAEPRRLCIHYWNNLQCFRHLSSLKFFKRSLINFLQL